MTMQEYIRSLADRPRDLYKIEAMTGIPYFTLYNWYHGRSSGCDYMLPILKFYIDHYGTDTRS